MDLDAFWFMERGTGSVRRDKTFLRAIEMGVGSGFYMLDCYNDTVVADGICFSITTRIDACNNYFLLEVYEEVDPD